MPNPFKDLKQDISHLLTAAAKNGADAGAPRRKRGGQPGNQNARMVRIEDRVRLGV